MNLNIKSAEAHRLAAQLARETGDSITGAATKAIRAELPRLDNKDKKRARIDALLDYTAQALRGGPGSADIDALLYDAQTGLHVGNDFTHTDIESALQD